MCFSLCRLTLEQKELCRSRLKLLCYLDRLATYEVRVKSGLENILLSLNTELTAHSILIRVQTARLVIIMLKVRVSVENKVLVLCRGAEGFNSVMHKA